MLSHLNKTLDRLIFDTYAKRDTPADALDRNALEMLERCDYIEVKDGVARFNHAGLVEFVLGPARKLAHGNPLSQDTDEDRPRLRSGRLPNNN